MRKMHTGKPSTIDRNLYKTSIETNGLLCSMVDIVSCSFHDISLLCHLCFGLPNLLVAFFFTWQSGDRSEEVNGLLPCPFLAWHDDSNRRLPCFGVCVGSCPPAPGRNCQPSFGCSCLFWQMMAAFSRWPSTLLSFLLLFQSYLSRFLSCPSFLPVISVMSVISAMVSAISACHFHLVFRIRHHLCCFRLPVSCRVLFLPVASTASFASACVFCLSAVFGIHPPSTFSAGWEGVGGANSAFEMNRNYWSITVTIFRKS